MPAELEKSKDGNWTVRGLASTESRDQQGEIIIQKGMDLTPIDKKQGYLNFDHKTGPENLIGTISGYTKTKKGLYVEGNLFKNHTRAKSVYEIMSSLSDGDKGRVGLSVEGAIVERDSKNPKIIKKCKIKNVALTFNPVNTDTYADLVKSFNDSEVEFGATEDVVSSEKTENAPVFSANQVITILEKALAISDGAQAPAEKQGGDALVTEELDKKKKKQEHSVEVTKKSLKKMSSDLYKSNIKVILDRLQELYPDNSRQDIWKAVKDRLNTKFPEINPKKDI